MNMWNTIKPKLPAVLALLGIIAVTALLKLPAAKAGPYHDALEYVLASLGAIGVVAIKALFGDSAAKVEQALELPPEKK